MLPFDSSDPLITVLFTKTRQAVERNGFICIFRLFSFSSLLQTLFYLEYLCNYYEIYVLWTIFRSYQIILYHDKKSLQRIFQDSSRSCMLFGVCRSWMAHKSFLKLEAWSHAWRFINFSCDSLRTLAKINAITWRRKIKSGA